MDEAACELFKPRETSWNDMRVVAQARGSEQKWIGKQGLSQVIKVYTIQ